MSNELVRIEPATMAELRAFASDAGKTGFYGAKSPEQALLIAMTGRDLGLSYAQSLRAFHVIEGKPTMTSDGMVAAILASGKALYFTTLETSATSCTVATQRKGSPVASQMTFTMEDARRAGLAGKAMWSKYPREMLRARAKAALARDVYPDALAGCYEESEAADIAGATEVLGEGGADHRFDEGVGELEHDRRRRERLAALLLGRDVRQVQRVARAEQEALTADDPEHDPGRFGGCFLVVTEVKRWGVQGYVTPLPNEGGQAFYRVAFDKIVRIGRAEWALDRGDE